MADFIAFEVYAGRDRNHSLVIQSGGVALDITGATITLNVKKSRSSKTNVFTMVTPTQITIDTPLSGLATAKFIDTLTDGLAGMYWIELVVTTAAADELKLAEGRLNILP